MKLTHIRDVLAVAQCGSLRAAARHLRVAQPALTRSIQEIERELGASLFERHAKGAKVTKFGEIFLRRARTIQEELRRAGEEIAQFKGSSLGQVSVAMSTASTIALMPSAMTAFRKRYPQAMLKVTESLYPGIENQLLEGTIDFYVGPFDPNLTSASVRSDKLFEYRRLILARNGHSLAQARTIEDLKDASWVRPLTLAPQSSEIDFDEMFERINGFPPRIVMSAHSALMTLLVVANSDLVTILPQQWLELPFTAERLISLDAAQSLPILSMCIVQRHGMPLTPMAEHLTDAIYKAAINYHLKTEGVLPNKMRD